MNWLTRKKNKTGNELIPADEQTANPNNLIALGLEKGASLEQMKELYAFKRQWEADEAKKAYVQAVTAFKANPPKIFKDKLNKQYGSMYTSIECLVNSAIPALSEHGLSHRWDSRQDDGLVFVTCILSHVLGHSESVTMSAPPDDSGNKNLIQRIKSTRTYLKGDTFEAITGLASETFNQSDDGNGAGATQPQNNNAAPEQTLLSVYPDKLFTANYPAWVDLVQAGKPHANIINKLSTTYTLTDEQKKKITEIT